MSNLVEIIHKAQQLKPKFGERCNHCGWCCLTEVCPTGLVLSDSVIPCKFLRESSNKYYCKLAEYPFRHTELNELLSVGTGCDAITQPELIEYYKNETIIHL